MRDALALWTPRHWWTAAWGTLATALVIGLPTDVIPNPVFGRPVPVTWWSYPALAVTAVLGGLLLATYVRVVGSDDTTDDTPDDMTGDMTGDDPGAEQEIDRPTRLGGLGGLLSFFAVGCPVCNKVVLLALGTTGARQWFEPVQPYLAVASIALMGLAVRARLRGSVACPTPRPSAPTDGAVATTGGSTR